MENLQTKIPCILSTETNPVDLVPEEERAVEPESIEQTVTVLGVHISNPLVDMITDEDRAVFEITENTALSEAKAMGCFAPTIGMAHIQSTLSNNLYAIIRTDSNGTRYFEYCQQYSNGSFSPTMRVAQSDLFLAASYNFMSKNISERRARARVEKFLTKAYEEYMGKTTGEELLDVSKILHLLFLVRNQLPVDKSAIENVSAEEFYIQVMESATLLINYQFPKRSYYTFEEGDILHIAYDLDMKKNDLLKKMKEYNLLYLTESSKGYQTCVRFVHDAEDTDSGKPETYTEWRYCVFRFDNFKKEAAVNG